MPSARSSSSPAAAAAAAAPRRECTSRGTERPVEAMIFSWVFCIVLPAAALAWHSTKRVSVVFGATLATPALAILQGALGILTYRVHFGDAPLPQTPSHGVVVVHPDDKKQQQNKTDETTTADEPSKTETAAATEPTTPQSLRQLSGALRRQPIAGLPLPSLGCECAGGSSSSASGATTAASLAKNNLFLTQKSQEAPLRLLVVGDSLAIGVGQAKSCTPIMPEAIAKTLSKQLGGRAVYWTCHGAPGASTGWIVREIERGVAYLEKKQTQSSCGSAYGEDDDDEDETELESLIMSNCSDTDDSSSDESSSDGEGTARRGGRHFVRTGIYRGACDPDENDHHRHSTNRSTGAHSCGATEPRNDEHHGIPLSQWKENLAQHRKRFNHPEVLGPYDVVVVLTGSNDLKSAFFPFLLTGEDAEFRRQARERGGSYTKELRRLLDTLNKKTQERINNIVHRVEVATESVRERVEETMEYIAPGSSHRLHSPRHQKRLLQQRSSSGGGDDSFFPDHLLLDNVKSNATTSGSREVNEEEARRYPLVVLPGMPSRALPIFKSAPLRWLAIPIVDIMDMHKRNFAKAHPGEVVFIPPLSVDDLSQYAHETGEVWEQKGVEDTVLALRDIRRRDCRRIESDMRQYYGEAAEKKRSFLRKILPQSLFPTPHPISSLFSIDQVHPCDEGYDCWGRYIGASIAEEMRKLQNNKAL